MALKYDIDALAGISGLNTSGDGGGSADSAGNPFWKLGDAIKNKVGNKINWEPGDAVGWFSSVIAGTGTAHGKVAEYGHKWKMKKTMQRLVNDPNMTQDEYQKLRNKYDTFMSRSKIDDDNPGNALFRNDEMFEINKGQNIKIGINQSTNFSTIDENTLDAGWNIHLPGDFKPTSLDGNYYDSDGIKQEGGHSLMSQIFTENDQKLLKSQIEVNNKDASLLSPNTSLVWSGKTSTLNNDDMLETFQKTTMYENLPKHLQEHFNKDGNYKFLFASSDKSDAVHRLSEKSETKDIQGDHQSNVYKSLLVKYHNSSGNLKSQLEYQLKTLYNNDTLGIKKVSEDEGWDDSMKFLHNTNTTEVNNLFEKKKVWAETKRVNIEKATKLKKDRAEKKVADEKERLRLQGIKDQKRIDKQEQKEQDDIDKDLRLADEKDLRKRYGTSDPSKIKKIITQGIADKEKANAEEAAKYGVTSGLWSKFTSIEKQQTIDEYNVKQKEYELEQVGVSHGADGKEWAGWDDDQKNSFLKAKEVGANPKEWMGFDDNEKAEWLKNNDIQKQEDAYDAKVSKFDDKKLWSLKDKKMIKADKSALTFNTAMGLDNASHLSKESDNAQAGLISYANVTDKNYDINSLTANAKKSNVTNLLGLIDKGDLSLKDIKSTSIKEEIKNINKTLSTPLAQNISKNLKTTSSKNDAVNEALDLPEFNTTPMNASGSMNIFNPTDVNLNTLPKNSQKSLLSIANDNIKITSEYANLSDADLKEGHSVEMDKRWKSFTDKNPDFVSTIKSQLEEMKEGDKDILDKYMKSPIGGLISYILKEGKGGDSLDIARNALIKTRGSLDYKFDKSKIKQEYQRGGGIDHDPDTPGIQGPGKPFSMRGNIPQYKNADAAKDYNPDQPGIQKKGSKFATHELLENSEGLFEMLPKGSKPWNTGNYSLSTSSQEGMVWNPIMKQYVYPGDPNAKSVLQGTK